MNTLRKKIKKTNFTFEIDANLHTLHGEIPGIGMDSKFGGGIHMWIRGDVFEDLNGRKSISVHLTKEQAIMLGKELIYRVYKELQGEVDRILAARI